MLFRKLVLCLFALSLASCRAEVRTPTSPRATEPAWSDWSDATFTRAREQHKLILLSLQADFCHWCHVMNATTYRDPRVLALLAEHFVVLRADEASRPDLRERYAPWGWPATALLTPDAQPIVNLRGHQPADQFAALLGALVDKQRRGEALGAKNTSAHADSAAPAPADALSVTRALALAQLDATYDPQQGGWGTPQKYPYAAPVEHALLRAAYGERERQERAVSSLHGYRQLVDAVAGGMFQYSMDGVWTRPHYEKLLSIQAGAIGNFSAAYRGTGEPSFLAAAQHSASYVLTTLRSPEGAFYASQEADVGQVGGPEYLPGATYYARDAHQRMNSRAPSVDAHVYANLNGMFIAALCELYRADPDPRWLLAAREATDAVQRQLARGPAFLHSAQAVGEAESAQVFYLSDQVEMARALYALSLAAVDPELAQRANATVDWVLANLHDAVRGAFFSNTPRAAAVGIFRERIAPYDENAKLARLLLHRSHIADDAHFAELAKQALVALSDRDGVQALGRQVGEYLLALEQLVGPYVMFSVVGEASDPRTAALLHAAQRLSLPQGIVALSAPDKSRYPYPGKPAIYLCSENACSSPVTEVERLAGELASFVTAAD